MEHAYFMEKALELARAALAAGEFPVGCLAVYDGEILVTGARSGSAGYRPNEVDHAEMQALRRLAVLEKEFQYPDITVYSTLEPCLMCYGALLVSNVGKIVYAYEDVMGGGTGCDLAQLPLLYRTRRTEVIPHVLREESLALLKAFFADPSRTYWRGSLLAEYTLGQ